jgi:hypothetical protein
VPLWQQIHTAGRNRCPIERREGRSLNAQVVWILAQIRAGNLEAQARRGPRQVRTQQLGSVAGRRYPRTAKVPLTIRIPEHLRQELTYAALEAGVSLNAEII